VADGDVCVYYAVLFLVFFLQRGGQRSTLKFILFVREDISNVAKKHRSVGMRHNSKRKKLIPTSMTNSDWLVSVGRV
jgi:hypothetical protein